MKNAGRLVKHDAIVGYGYAVGMMGTLISCPIAGLVLFSVESLWKYGFAGLLLFGGIWVVSIWFGLRTGWLKPRYSTTELKSLCLTEFIDFYTAQLGLLVLRFVILLGITLAIHFAIGGTFYLAVTIGFCIIFLTCWLLAQRLHIKRSSN